MPEIPNSRPAHSLVAVNPLFTDVRAILSPCD